ncbi:hypothetical protein SAMN05216482_8436 [Streptomyces sp. PAN_FS17]|nr:hypothetical protein SAMN05216482_8436 [Streptomyces sp. PAN_FS17]
MPATLSSQIAGALLEAVLPLGELRGAAWRVALGAPGPRFLALPFVLRGGVGGVRVVRVPGPNALRRLVRRVRRRLGTAMGRTATRLRARTGRR